MVSCLNMISMLDVAVYLETLQVNGLLVSQATWVKLSVLEAEAWAVLQALQHAWDMGFKSIILESDCKDIVDILHHQPDEYSPHSLVILKIAKLLSLPWSVNIIHISRNQNMAVDRLPKEALNVSSFFHCVSPFLRTLMDTDCILTEGAVQSPQSASCE
ncbi:uncharacterized protein LOC129286132 [Prosopis cineraria]|uniref:uncharacterized protein LOC129286132 n=1 Tax=Prosopis cineraria TaxID=364024 RepID=UPI00240F7641|nr:uncharacterized protein LOC129286132 [Prosopis cineraria]